jgi:hypothetical protein
MSKIGQMPAFASDENQGTDEVLNAPVDENLEESATSESDVETGVTAPVEGEEALPEPPAGEEPASFGENQTGDSISTSKQQEELQSAIEGLKETRREILEEIRDLRGQRREGKQAELETVQDKIDNLEDVNPDDVNLIDRILRSKGYIPKGDVQHMLSESKKADEIDKFLADYPEYNEDNDPDRKRFEPLIREVSLYKEPADPKDWGRLLRKAHKALTGSQGSQVASGRGVPAMKRQAEIAGVGSGGVQRSSSVKSFTPEHRSRLLDGGWSEEEVKEMEANQ